VLPVLTAGEMRQVDRRAIEVHGIPGAVLMENAGCGAADLVLHALGELGRRRGGRVAVVCGKGGNGGDGFVVARRLAQRGVRASAWLVASPGEVGGDAAGALAALVRVGDAPRSAGDSEALAGALREADLVVDALLGTGSRGAPEGRVAAAISAINASGRPVVALDIPSGLPADGGPAPGPAVRATLTATFAGLKRGLVTGPGLDLAGRVAVVPIGVPPGEVARGVATFLIERDDVAARFPPRPRHAHKGTYGHLLIVAGSLGKTGAAALAAHAAMRAGAGLATVATAASQQPVVAALVREAMTAALAETPGGSLAAKAGAAIGELAEARDALAVGPGLGLDPDTQALARALARGVPRPMVLDADALTALAGDLAALAAAPAPRCLTPHPGEMARLAGASVAAVEADRIETARAFARAHRVHLVLKGAGTVVADPAGPVYVNPTGNPGMASGGMGDVLTGIAGAFLARGLDATGALQAAVYLHGLAADLAARRTGLEALVAGDVADAMGEAFAAVLGPGR
jgi:NAD(P)H-hydrate epimerase